MESDVTRPWEDDDLDEGWRRPPLQLLRMTKRRVSGDGPAACAPCGFDLRVEPCLRDKRRDLLELLLPDTTMDADLGLAFRTGRRVNHAVCALLCVRRCCLSSE